MGASFCVVFETEVPPHGTLGGDNPMLLRRQRKLDRLATGAGLTPLGAFESYDPEDAADFLDDEQLASLPPVCWFAAADGLAAVRGLITHLSANTAAIADQAKVLAELEEVAAELANAEQAGVRFRFAVVP